MKKYELVMDDNICIDGMTLYRIRALRDFSNVKAGDLGGYIGTEYNLSHHDTCWIYSDAKVYDNAEVYDNARLYDTVEIFGNAKIFADAKILGCVEVYGYAKICGTAEVCGRAKIFGEATIYGRAEIFGEAEVYGRAEVCGRAKIYNNAKIFGDTKVTTFDRISINAEISSSTMYITIGPIGSRDAYTTFYKARNNTIYVTCGCFTDSIDMFKRRVISIHNNNQYAKEYLLAIELAKVKIKL